jgi:hypothetical protein
MNDGRNRAVPDENGHILTLQGHTKIRFRHEIVTDRDGFSQSVAPDLSPKVLQLKICEPGVYLSPLTIK